MVAAGAVRVLPGVVGRGFEFELEGMSSSRAFRRARRIRGEKPGAAPSRTDAFRLEVGIGVGVVELALEDD